VEVSVEHANLFLELTHKPIIHSERGDILGETEDGSREDNHADKASSDWRNDFPRRCDGIRVGPSIVEYLLPV
jgi:hypothetical protein